MISWSSSLNLLLIRKLKKRENRKHWKCNVALNSNISVPFFLTKSSHDFFYREIAVNGYKFNFLKMFLSSFHTQIILFGYIYFFVYVSPTDCCVVKCVASCYHKALWTSSETIKKEKSTHLMLSCASRRTCKNYKKNIIFFSFFLLYARCNSDSLTTSLFILCYFFFFLYFADCQCCFKCYGRRMCNIVKILIERNTKVKFFWMKINFFVKFWKNWKS